MDGNRDDLGKLHMVEAEAHGSLTLIPPTRERPPGTA